MFLMSNIKKNDENKKVFFIGPNPVNITTEHGEATFRRQYEKLYHELSLNRDNPKLEIHIYINNNPGGQLYAILSLIDLINDSKCKIITYCTGYIASAASLLFLSGDIKIMFEHSKIMLHEVSLNINSDLVYLTHDYMKKYNRIMKNDNKIIKNLLIRYCIPDKYINKIFNKHKEVYIDYNKALKIGIIDSTD
jgi:ATP-dependent protease ClpP protease subunit